MSTALPDRETAYRLFAAEFDDASLSYAESDEERAPNYVVTPTGARVNRLFAVGVLTEIEAVNDTQLRARIVDPTGAFVVYAGQYQPEALSFLESTTPPKFVAVTGKARTFQPEDSDRVFTSVRPETLSEVDASTRDRFVVGTAERTLERVGAMRDALARAERDDDLRGVLEDDGIDVSLAAGVPRAIAHYGTTSEYLDAVERMAHEAAAMVAGDREEVAPLSVDPGTGPAAGSPDRTTVEDADEPTAGESATGEPATDSPAADEPAAADPAATESSTDGFEDDSDSAVGDETASDDEPIAEDDSATEPESDSEPTAESASAGGADAASTTASESPTPEPDFEESTPEDDAADEEGSVDPDATDEVGGVESVDGSDPSDDATVEADLDDPEEFELDEEVRERIEAEYGTEFESASQVDDPGEADIETPTPDTEPDASATETDSTGGAADDPEADHGTDAELGTDEEIDTESADASADTETGAAAETGVATETEASAGVDATDAADETGAADAGAADIDPEKAVVAAMRDLDDGDGVNRDTLVERVGEEYGLAPAEADDGIQAALMSGACYEPDDDTLKPI